MIKLLTDFQLLNDVVFQAKKIQYGSDAFDELFSLEQFEKMLANERFVENDVFLYQSGKLINNEKFYHRRHQVNPAFNYRMMINGIIESHYKSHLTGIKINSIHEFYKPIYSLRKSLMENTKSTVSINSYYSPPGSKNILPVHKDPYNILILQIHGFKKFFFGKMTETELIANSEEIVLSQGDALYLPANLAHYAQPEYGAASLHLTIGFHPPDVSEYFDFFNSKNSKWHFLKNKKFPRDVDGNIDQEEFKILVEELSESLKREMLDPHFLENFLESNYPYGRNMYER